MPTFERGFRAWAERSASALRRELGLGPVEPLDPRDLAKHLGVRLVSPLDLEGLALDIRDQLLNRDPSGWSAATLQMGDMAIVLHNPQRSKGRQATDIVHELAHLLLGQQRARGRFHAESRLG